MTIPNLTLMLDGNGGFDVAEFVVHEHISALFRVDVTVYNSDNSLPFDELVGKSATFEIAGYRRWEGVCSLIQQAGVASNGLATYEVTLVPRLWLLTQRSNYRVFQNKTEVEIVSELLDEWALEFDQQANRDELLHREYRVQYAESDYAFAARLLEDAGVTFFFDHSAGTKLVITDAPHEREEIRELSFTDEVGSGSDRAVAMEVRLRRQTRPGRYVVGDWDFLRGHGQQPRFDAADGLDHEQQLERFHYLPGAMRHEVGPAEQTPVADGRGAMRVHEGSSKALVERRLAAKRAHAVTCSFTTNDHGVAPGALVQIIDHPHDFMGGDRRFLVLTSVLHGSAHDEWRQECEACDAVVPYRPPLTVHRPRTHGLMTATVTGPAGEEIWPDEHGRVLVKFHWDRYAELNETSSCWVPVSQAWAGAGYGMLNLPRIGHEVLIDFLNGDPDQPLIVGRVHTGVQTPPYPLPEKKALSVWKSCSTPGGDGFNEITLDDTAGAERIYMHAQYDKIVEVEHDSKEKIKRDSSSGVGRNSSSTVDVDRTEKTGVNRTTTVDADNTETVAGSETISIGGNQAMTVGGTRDVGVGGAHTVTVGPETYTVNGVQTVNVTAVKSETVGAVCSLGVGAAYNVSVGAAMTVSAGALYSLSTPLATISAPTYGVKCSEGSIEGADIKVIASGSLTLQGADVSINGSTITIGGGTINIKGGTVNVNGGTTNVAGGTTNVTGGSVNVN